jgi:fucose 4-O-acetylase-like acetyltransferase
VTAHQQCKAARQGREEWIDIAKGVGIFLVVFEHVVRGVVKAQIEPISALFQITDYTVYTFHMPLFFILSGVTAQLYRRRHDSRWRPDWIIFVAYAYVFWSVLHLVLRCVFGSYINQPAHLMDVVRLAYEPIDQFWFLYTLLLCHLLHVSARSVPWLLGAVAVSFGMRYFDIGGVPIVFSTTTYFVFYAAGLIGTEALLRWRPSSEILFATLGLFSLAAILNWQVSPGGIVDWGAIPAAFLGSGVVIATSKLARGHAANVLSTLGRLSLPIFLSHILATSATRAFLLALGVHSNVTLHIILGTVAGLTAPIALYRVLAYFRLLPLFGFAPFDAVTAYSG